MSGSLLLHPPVATTVPTAAERAALMRLASLLLQYPDDGLLASREALATEAERLSGLPGAGGLVGFAGWWRGLDVAALRRHYVETFDLRRRTGLFLTYHLHGDTRRRGMALLTLKQRYRLRGLTPPPGELPDYLPLVLEFAATVGPRDGEAPLRQHRRGLELLRTGLASAGSPYAAVLDAVCGVLPVLGADDLAAVAELAAAGPPAEDVGLDPYGAAGSAGPTGPAGFARPTGPAGPSPSRPTCSEVRS